jgi:glyoxylase-like metal-dependent hydrolase (beta-lactamase superfamily II)
MAISVSHAPTTDRLVREVEPGVFLIDHHFRGAPGVIASYLIADGDALTLVEAGPASTVETLLAGVRRAGFDPARIAQVVVTHIHLDHAGAAGTLLRRLPRAQLFVHPVGAPHLVDPSKLMASATRIYGELMQPLWGEMLPVPADRLTVLGDRAELSTGGRTLRAHDTPGHANHHLALHDLATGAVFTGDVAGIRLDGLRHVRPPTPPPEFDPEAWRRSVATLRDLAPRRLYLTHFGGYDDVAWHLDELLARTWFWTGWVASRLAAGEEPQAVGASLREVDEALLAATTDDPTILARYESAGNYRMSVDGIARWWKKREARPRA